MLDIIAHRDDRGGQPSNRPAPEPAKVRRFRGLDSRPQVSPQGLAYSSDNQGETDEDPVRENLNLTQLETPDADGGTNCVVAATGPRSTAVDARSYAPDVRSCALDVQRDGSEIGEPWIDFRKYSGYH
jgi:hypothetical protein